MFDVMAVVNILYIFRYYGGWSGPVIEQTNVKVLINQDWYSKYR